MAIAIEIDEKTNIIALRSYEIVLAEFTTSVNEVNFYRMKAVEQGDAHTIANLSMLLLQGLFGVQSLVQRAVCYKCCIENAAYSKEFWLKVAFN